MPAKHKTMHQIKSIFKLKNANVSLRNISKQTKISRITIREYLNRIHSLGIDLGQAIMLPDEELQLLLINQENKVKDESNARLQYIENQMEYYRHELQRKGVTKTLLWQEYKKNNPQGYGHSQFCWHLLQFEKANKAVFKMYHSPGQQMMVDFAGDKLEYIDAESGEIIKCEVLVCVLPYSGITYVEVLASQEQTHFMMGLCNAFNYFEGVPLSVKCDNLKSAVTKADRYDPTFTEAMEMLCRFFNTTAVASRVRKPRDKANVENSVRLAYQRIYAPLRDIKSYSLAQLQQKVKQQLEMHNNQLFQGRDYSRRVLFETQEKESLQALPLVKYVYQKVTLGKVQNNYHVILGKDFHQYSVPYTLIGKTLKIIYTNDLVEIYDDLTRVAIHKRNFKRNGYTTLVDHMPTNHQFMYQYKGWNADYFINAAKSIGPFTVLAIESILKSRTFIEQSYNACLGVLRLSKLYSPERIEKTCQLLQASPKINYGLIERILRNNMDKQEVEPVKSVSNTLYEHDNLRDPNSFC